MSTIRSLDQRLASVRQEGRLAFMPFLVVGDPDPQSFLQLADALVESGADALELGFPYSDPAADGPVIQAADARALAAGVDTQRAFDLIAELTARHAIPVSVLVYYNLVLQLGIDTFYGRARDAGVDAVLVADVPLELADPLVTTARARGVAPVFLASAVTTQPRARQLAEVCESYVYAAARVGVTGAQDELSEGPLEGLVGRLRAGGVHLPILAGFGLSTPEHVQSVGRAGADGAIVGSAIVAAASAHYPDIDAARRAVSEMSSRLVSAARTSSPPPPAPR